MEAPTIYIASAEGALRQGEIVSELIEVKLKLLADGSLPQPDQLIEFQSISHPFAIVVSQDCELDWDFKARHYVAVGGKMVSAEKLVPNVLFGVVATAEELRGTHGITSDIWKRIRQNKDERYHFLERAPAEYDLQQRGLPELGIDF
ncbi:MAG TPA: hypothetical protein PK867_22130, partial [Pirellulales bacterium]|nr:hypothetical protein [Pirellulales bacterium]